MNRFYQILSVALLGIPLLVTWVGVSRYGGYPSNDDPFYGRPAQILADESRFQVIRQQGELSASSALHTVLGGSAGWLFGFSYRVLFVAVIVQLWLASIGINAIFRSAGCDRAISLFFAGVFLFNPLCFGHGFTFMTDGPALAWCVLAVFCFQRGLRQQQLRWLWLGSLAAGGAFWIRQTHVMIIGFPAAAVCVIWLFERHGKRLVAGVAASLLPAVLAVLLFESGWIVFGDEGRVHTIVPSQINLRQLMIDADGFALLMGFLLLPALPLFAAEHWRQRQARSAPTSRLSLAEVLGLGASVLLLVPFVATQGRAVLTSATGTFIQNTHLGPIFLSDFEMPSRWSDMGDIVWPAWTWQTLSLLAIVNVGCIVGLIVRGVAKNRQRLSINGTSAAITFGLIAASLPMIAVILFVGTGILDRYWMLLIPVVLALIAETGGEQLSISGRRTRMLSCGLLALQLCFSIVLVRDFLAWNQTRWIQYESWLAEGHAPLDIDGGRDMNAWYRSAEDCDTMPRPGDQSSWWSGHAKLALAIGQREGWHETGRLKWNAWITQREHEILMLRRDPAVTSQLEASKSP